MTGIILILAAVAILLKGKIKVTSTKMLMRPYSNYLGIVLLAFAALSYVIGYDVKYNVLLYSTLVVVVILFVLLAPFSLTESEVVTTNTVMDSSERKKYRGLAILWLVLFIPTTLIIALGLFLGVAGSGSFHGSNIVLALMPVSLLVGAMSGFLDTSVKTIRKFIYLPLINFGLVALISLAEWLIIDGM